MIDQNNFTEMAAAALRDAESLATRNGQQEIDNWHLLLALVEQEHGIVWGVLDAMETSPSALQLATAREVEKKPSVQGRIEANQMFLAENLRQALEGARKCADKLKDEYISTEHLLLGIVRCGQPVELKKFLQKFYLCLKLFDHPILMISVSTLNSIQLNLDEFFPGLILVLSL